MHIVKFESTHHNNSLQEAVRPKLSSKFTCTIKWKIYTIEISYVSWTYNYYIYDMNKKTVKLWQSETKANVILLLKDDLYDLGFKDTIDINIVNEIFEKPIDFNDQHTVGMLIPQLKSTKEKQEFNNYIKLLTLSKKDFEYINIKTPEYKYIQEFISQQWSYITKTQIVDLVKRLQQVYKNRF